MTAPEAGIMTASMENLEISSLYIPLRPPELNEPSEPRRPSEAPEYPRFHEHSNPPRPYEPHKPPENPETNEPPEFYESRKLPRPYGPSVPPGTVSSFPLTKAMLPSASSPMKILLYEINKQFSETPTVISHLFQSEDVRKNDHLFASVCLKKYNGPVDESHFFHPKFMRKMENLPSEIFCTSDEYPWKGLYSKTYHLSRTKSTYLFILGEAGCGKTSYCQHLIRQWCQGQDLRKFDHIFYVDTSVLQTSKTSISDIIFTAVFGNNFVSENELNHVLRNEKCLILIDGDDIFRERLIRKYYLEEGIMEYRNCVFVFLLRPLQFVKSFSLFELRDVNAHFIQLSGLDEKGMVSLYSNIIVKIDFFIQSKSPHEIKIADSQQIMKKSTLQKETKEPDTALSETESYLFHGEVEADTQAYIAQNPTESEQRVKKSGIGESAKEAGIKPKTEKYVSEHGRKKLEFYRIKGVLEKILCENYNSIMQIPMFGCVCVGLLAEGNDLPTNLTSVYLCLLDRLVGEHEPLSGRKGEKGIKPFDLFLTYENVHRHVETLRKLGNIAFDSILFFFSQLVDYNTLDGYLGETEINFAIRTGLLVPEETFKDAMANEQNVRFLHKTIQDSLVSIYIVIEKEEAVDSFCHQLTNMDVIIYVSHVIMMVCGLNPNLGCRMTRSIKDVLDKDINVCRHRQDISVDSFMREFYYLQLSWYIEYKDGVTIIGSDAKDNFYVSDIYVDDKTDKETMTKTIALLSDKNIIATSVYIDNVSTESDLTDKVLNDFLVFNTSLETIYINSYQSHRSIVPLSFPFLRVLKLWHVHIRPACNEDEATKPLLYNLPMLQRLDVFEIVLNKRLLGLTSDGGIMPVLNYVLINGVDMSDQSIEFAPDMTDIENIHLHGVKMSSQGWMKFIRSLLNIHHSYQVSLYDSDIDTESQDMVRTNKVFGVMQDDSYCFEFCRINPRISHH